ncbi:MAG: isoamylase early set domain-containing protein [Anaerolineae bacterium]
MITKRPSTAEGKIVVTFEIHGSIWADQIHLVGDFNDWNRESLPFRHTRQEAWRIELELEEGREYRFRYLVDGAHWRSDRHADLHTGGADGLLDSVVLTETTPALHAHLPQAA